MGAYFHIILLTLAWNSSCWKRCLWKQYNPNYLVLTFVFYCFAALLPVSGVYSIISLVISGLLMNVFRPIFKENASAVPYNGGSYSYLVNFASKRIAVVAAAVTALDAITTVLSQCPSLTVGRDISR
jgi:amino acid transporter